MEETLTLFNSIANIPIKELRPKVKELFGGDNFEYLTAAEVYDLFTAMRQTPLNEEGEITDADPLCAFIRCVGRPDRSPAALLKELVPGVHRKTDVKKVQEVCPAARLFADAGEYTNFVCALVEFSSYRVEPFDVVTFKSDPHRVPGLAVEVDGRYIKVLLGGAKATRDISDVDTVSSRIRELTEAAYVTNSGGRTIYKVVSAPEICANCIRVKVTAVKTPQVTMYLLGMTHTVDIEWANPGEWIPLAEDKVKEAIYGND